MSKEEILEEFKDINQMYNDCTKYDTLKRMLEELENDEQRGSGSSEEGEEVCGEEWWL